MTLAKKVDPQTLSKKNPPHPPPLKMAGEKKNFDQKSCPKSVQNWFLGVMRTTFFFRKKFFFFQNVFTEFLDFLTKIPLEFFQSLKNTTHPWKWTLKVAKNAAK